MQCGSRYLTLEDVERREERTVTAFRVNCPVSSSRGPWATDHSLDIHEVIEAPGSADIHSYFQTPTDNLIPLDASAALISHRPLWPLIIGMNGPFSAATPACPPELFVGYPPLRMPRKTTRDNHPRMMRARRAVLCWAGDPPPASIQETLTRAGGYQQTAAQKALVEQVAPN